MVKKKSTIIDRLKYFIDYKSLSVRSFSKNVGISHSLLSNTKAIGSDKLESILSIYSEINPTWLLTGNGEMLENLSDKKEHTFKKNNAFSSDNRPIIEIAPESNKLNVLLADVKASAGFGSIIDNPEQLQNLPAISLPNAPFGLNIAFQIQGDSMHGTIRHLDFVAANKVEDWSHIIDGYVHIIIDKFDGILCKRLYKTRGGFRVVSDNTKYPSYIVKKENVVGVFRAFLRLSSDFSPSHAELDSIVDGVNSSIETLRKELEEVKAKVKHL